MPATPVRSRLPNVGSPPPLGSVAPLPGTFSVHSGAFSRASRFAEAYCGPDLAPVALQFLADHHGVGGPDALAELGLRDADRDACRPER